MQAKRLKVIIIGTTVSGKSHLSLQLGHHFGWNIINTDTAAFYSGADILSGKPTKEEMQRVRHHCVDFLPLDDCCYNMKDFISKVDQIVETRSQHGVVIVGGSNFYNEKVIFQRRSRLISEAQQDHHSRLKHNIGLFANEFLSDENLKGLVDTKELVECFQKLLQKEKEIPHHYLQSPENRLKYVLLHAPNIFLEILMQFGQAEAILRFSKRLFPFCGDSLISSDANRTRALLRDFVCGKPQQRAIVEEGLKKDEQEEMLVVILCNTDQNLVVQLIRRRLESRLLTRPGISEIFKVFERLLIRPANAFNILDKYIKKAGQFKFTGAQLVLLAYQDLIDLLKINKANRYGILNTRGYREFVPFYEKFWLAVVQRFFKLAKGPICWERFAEFYEQYRNSLIKELRKQLKAYFKQENKEWGESAQEISTHKNQNLESDNKKMRSSIIEKQDEKLNQTMDSIKLENHVKKSDPEVPTKKTLKKEINYPAQSQVKEKQPRPKDLLSVFIDCVQSLEKEMLNLYKKQRSWLSNRVMNNNLLKNRLMVKNIDKSHLNDISFRREVVEPVIEKICQIMKENEVKNLGAESVEFVKRKRDDLVEEREVGSQSSIKEQDLSYKVENPFLRYRQKKKGGKESGIGSQNVAQNSKISDSRQNLENKKEYKNEKIKKEYKKQQKNELKKSDDEEQFLKLAKRGRLRSNSMSHSDFQDLEKLVEKSNLSSKGFKRVQYEYPKPRKSHLSENLNKRRPSKFGKDKKNNKNKNNYNSEIKNKNLFNSNNCITPKNSKFKRPMLRSNPETDPNSFRKYKNSETQCAENESQLMNNQQRHFSKLHGSLNISNNSKNLATAGSKQFPPGQRKASEKSGKQEIDILSRIIQSKFRRGSTGRLKKVRFSPKRYSFMVSKKIGSGSLENSPEFQRENPFLQKKDLDLKNEKMKLENKAKMESGVERVPEASLKSGSFLSAKARKQRNRV